MARKESPLANRKIGGGLFERTAREPEPEKVPRFKRTYHLPQDAIDQLEELQLKRKPANGGKRPELSDLVAEAIRALAAAEPVDA